MMKAKNLIKRVTIGILAVVLSTSVVWADDNPGLIQRAKDACKNATYDIQTVTNDIDGWPQGPAIMCDSAVVMEAESGEVLYNKAMDERRYPASTTKIMTALVALEHSNLTDTVTFTAEGLKEAVPGNSYVTPVIQEGETLTMEQCLYAIMLVSGNEVSTQVAMQVGGSVEGFVEMMNEKAQEIGCKDTHFVNANGLHDENHYTTAHDLAMIAQEAYKNEEFRKIVGSRYYTIPATNKTAEERVLANHHALLGEGDWHYDGCLGGKTGYTDTALKKTEPFIFVWFYITKAQKFLPIQLCLQNIPKNSKNCRYHQKNIHSQAEPQLCQKEQQRMRLRYRVHKTKMETNRKPFYLMDMKSVRQL